MAFGSAVGHGNLPNGNFSPVIYSQKVLKYFRKSSVCEDITNTDYFGEIANYGDTVNIIKEPEINISDYVRGQETISQDLIDDQISLTVDQAKYFQFQVDDIEQKHAHTNWGELATSAAAYKLKDSFDTAILAHIEANVNSGNVYGADTASNNIDVGFSAGEVSPLAVMNRLSRLLDEDNVPRENRFFVAGPIFWEEMMDENSKLMGVDFTGDSSSILRNGRVTDGLIRGFKAYTSNNMPVSTSQSFKVALAGHMSAVATASQIAKIESFRSHNTFADVVRGLHVYGRKVLRPSALAKCFYDVD